MKSKQLCAWKQFSVLESEHSLPDGRMLPVTVVHHPGAVLIVPLTGDGRLVLTRQYRPSIGRWLLEFPAGTLEPDEAILCCARRELAEEVQLQADSWRELGELIPAPGFCDEVMHTFLATGLSTAHGELDEDEVIEPVMLTLADFESRIASGEVVDAKTLALFARVRAMGLV